MILKSAYFLRFECADDPAKRARSVLQAGDFFDETLELFLLHALGEPIAIVKGCERDLHSCGHRSFGLLVAASKPVIKRGGSPVRVDEAQPFGKRNEWPCAAARKSWNGSEEVLRDSIGSTSLFDLVENLRNQARRIHVWRGLGHESLPSGLGSE